MAKAGSKSNENVVEGVFQHEPREARTPILKTYKIYIDGKFPRTESGRSYEVKAPDGTPLAQACRCSRKDVREAVVAARKAAPGWAAKTAYLRGQILYRIAEMLEGRTAQFCAEMESLGIVPDKARAEVAATVDRLVYFAGWTDKYQQVFGAVNPVASSHFNFSLPEPSGVIGVIAPEQSALLAPVGMLAPAIAGGNTVVLIGSPKLPLPLVTFTEVLQTSDLPAGVVNVLTGFREEMVETLTSHMDVNALMYADLGAKELAAAGVNAALNVKRVVQLDLAQLESEQAEHPYLIMECQEIKTTWHPVGI